MKLLEIFQEKNGQLSNMRVMSFIMCLVAVFIAVQSVYRPVDNYIFLITVISAFVPKVLQKFAEK